MERKKTSTKGSLLVLLNLSPPESTLLEILTQGTTDWLPIWLADPPTSHLIVVLLRDCSTDSIWKVRWINRLVGFFWHWSLCSIDEKLIWLRSQKGSNEIFFSYSRRVWKLAFQGLFVFAKAKEGQKRPVPSASSPKKELFHGRKTQLFGERLQKNKAREKL